MNSKASLSSSLALRFYDNRYLLVLGLLTILLAGFSALSNLPRIEDPRITNRYPRVVTFLPGASAERIEALVTDPIEDSLRELSEIKEIQSTSRAGVSVVQMELQDYIGPGENQQVFSKMRDRLNDVAAELPIGASAPDFNDKNSAVAFSLVTSIAWKGDSAPVYSVMNRLAEDLADRFRALGGTDNVRIYGEPSEEVSVALDGDALAALGLTASRVAREIAQADTKMPAGALRTADRDLFIELDGELGSVDRVRTIPLISRPDGSAVTVGDVADVRKSWRDPPFDIAYTDGKRSILVAVQTRRDIRLDRWATVARDAVETFAAETGAGVDVEVVFDQSTYTEDRLSNLSGNLLAGAALVMLVVFVGMGWRAAIIVGSSLPLSASLAVFGLSVAGQQIHQMSIFGMIIAIGLLIDNAIVMTDEVKKKLDLGEERTAAVRKALSHLFVPLLASTLTTILGFMPVFLLPGAMGDFVGPIATSVVLALAASFFVSITIIPALAGLALRRHVKGTQHHWWVDGLRSSRMKTGYERFLHTVLARPRLTVPIAMLLPVIGYLLAGTLGQQFFPPADRDQFEIEVWMSPDTSIARTAEITRQIDAVIDTYAQARQVNWLIGGSYPTIYYNRIMKQEGNNAYAQGMVYTHTVQGAKELTTILPGLLGDRFPEARVVVSAFAQGPPVEAPVGFRIEGPNTAVLKERGDELRRIMHTVPGIVATRASVTGGQAKLSFAADEAAAGQLGLSLTDIAVQMQTDLEGDVGGSLFEDVEEMPVRVRLQSADRNSAASIASLALVADPGSGRFIPAASLGQVELRPEASSISRLDGVRSNNVLGYIRRDALAIDVTNAILGKVESEGFVVPAGYQFEVAGDSEQQSDALGDLLTYLPILLMLMVGTIVLSFRSNRLALLIGTVAVLSVGLGMLSLWLGGYARGFNAIIGSVGLVGVAINGTIVVLAAIRANAESRAGDLDAIVRETIGATRHIVSTTATTVGGFIPLLLFSGGDFWPPLAIVIAGGVGFSITLSLLFTPAAYHWIYRPRDPQDRRIGLTAARPLGGLLSS